jgi:hypothetical protein
MRQRFIVTVSVFAFAMLGGACSSPSTIAPTAPNISPAATSSVAGSSAFGALKAGDACTVDFGSTQRPLPALHELEAWLNMSFAAASSTLTCGQVRSLDAKLETTVKALDQNPQNFQAACGTSGALLNELDVLIRNGSLAQLTFPPPVPNGPTTALGLAQTVNTMFCAAARGELVGPQP